LANKSILIWPIRFQFTLSSHWIYGMTDFWPSSCTQLTLHCNFVCNS
jgi:hypothetical protein